MSRRRRCFHAIPVVIVGLSLSLGATVLAAQGGPPGGGPGGGGPGGRGGPPPGMMRQVRDPVILDGPPAPDSMAVIARLDSAMAARYARLYQHLMETTRADRDSVRAHQPRPRDPLTEVPPVEGAPDRSRDRELDRRMGTGPGGMPAEMQEVQNRMNRLELQQQNFDEALRDLLAKDQWNRYRDWREARRAEARRLAKEAEARRERRDDH